MPRSTPWGAGVARTVVIILAAAAAGVLAVIYSAPLAVVAVVFATGTAAWYAPDAAVRLVVVLLVITPFVAVTPLLRPDALNYSVYYVVVALPVCVAVCGRYGRLRLDSGSFFLFLLVVNAAVTMAVHGVIATEYGPLLWGLTALSIYLGLFAVRDNPHGLVTAALLAFACAEAVLGLSQSLFGWPRFSLAAAELAVTDRGLLGYFLPGFATLVTNGTGTFAHFNALGALLALALPLAFGRLLCSSRRWGDVVLVIVLGAGLLTSYSRAGWLGGLVGCLIVFWASRRRSSRSWLPALVATVMLLGALLAPYLLYYYTATQNVSARVSTWDYAIGRWLDTPTAVPFGLGFGAFQQEYLQGAGAAGTRALSALHSGLLQILLELGVVGALVFAWFVVTTLRPHLRPRRPSWQVTLLGGIVGFLVSQTLDNALFSLSGVLVFALAACLRRPDAQPASRSAQGRAL